MMLIVSAQHCLWRAAASSAPRHARRQTALTFKRSFSIDDRDDFDGRLSSADSCYFGEIGNAIKRNPSNAPSARHLECIQQSSLAWRKNLKE
jgi:hypothetical protein